MAIPRAYARLALVAPLAAGCVASPAVPCVYCDGGKADTRMLVAGDVAASEAALFDLATGETAPPIDTADAFLPATRDVPAGEAPTPTPILDAGHLFVDDCAMGKAPGWEELRAPGSSAYPNDWFVIPGETVSLYAQGTLDAEHWRIAYAVAPLGPDQIVEAKLRVVDFYAEAPSYMAALFGRYDPTSDSGYLVALRGDGSVTIRRRERGVSASWGGGVTLGIRPAVWYTVRLEIIGGAITAFVDGTPVYWVTDDNPLESGGAALGTFGATLEAEYVLAAELE
ncbi:MAG: hypothetical protein JXP73_00780 [Deltaproteobacteria bacterium]|nr:hypothetical protein [Deltaproteobacteria bacterium]